MFLVVVFFFGVIFGVSVGGVIVVGIVLVGVIGGWLGVLFVMSVDCFEVWFVGMCSGVLVLLDSWWLVDGMLLLQF